MHKVGRVAEHVATLTQCIEHQRDVQLFKISNAAVHQLRAAA
jgi:hypothetical protein